MSLIAIQATKECGCCKAILWFRNEEAADFAFRQAGLKTCVAITDDFDDTYLIDTYPSYEILDLNEHQGLLRPAREDPQI